MKKRILTLIFIGLLSSLALNATEQYLKPAKSEIIFVFSYSLHPRLDRDFFDKYAEIFDLKKDKPDSISIPKKYNGWLPKDSYAPADDLISIAIHPSKKGGIVKLPYFLQNLYGSHALNVLFPLNIQVKVPKGVKYVYLGHFDYRRVSNVNMKYTDIKRIDNFDAAVKIIKKRYGQDAELVRLPLKELEKE